MNFFEGFLARYFGLLFDRWVGNDYEQGLANLKQFAESLPVSDFSRIEITRLHVPAQDILFVSTSSREDPVEIAAAMASAYEEIGKFMNEAGISMQGQPMAITRLREEGLYQFDAAIPVDVVPVEVHGQVRIGKSPSGDAVRAIHYGDFSRMMPSYEKMTAYMSAHGLSHGGVSWEHYISDPGTTATEDLVTHIYIMLDENVDK